MRNKIKFFILLSCLLLSCFFMSGCDASSGQKNYEENANLIQIKDELYYYEPTGIVYIVFNEDESFGYGGCGYMSPYYNANGNLCRYNKMTLSIVEIKD